MQIATVLVWALVGFVFALTQRSTVLRCTAGAERPASPPHLGVLEVTTAALFAALAYRFGLSLETLAYSSLSGFGVPLATTDLITRKLPNALLVAAFSSLAVIFGADAVLDGHGDSLVRTALIMVAALAIHSILYVLGAIAGGDVKLAGLLGAALGWISWEAAWSGLALGWILAGVIVGAARIVRRRTTNYDVPLGPFLLAGALLSILSLGPSTFAL
jgi:leader peptidase (prepilin peptidase)/N-methyltransferase